MAATDPAEGPTDPPEDEDLDDEGPPQSSFFRWDVWDEPQPERRLRQLPSITWAALRFVWRADRTSSLVTAGNDVVSALVGGAQVLVVGALLARLVGEAPIDRAVREATPWVAALVVTQLASSLFNAVVRGRSQLYQERVAHAANRRILAVASNVDLLSFESPAFFDRLQRVETQAQFRPIQVVQSTNMLLSGLSGSAGIVVALFVLQPWLVPALLATYLPVMLATRRAAWMQYEFVRGMSQLDRRRFYVAQLLTGRDAAKEVRAFGLRRALLDRYERLSHEHLAELHDVAIRRTRLIAGVEAASGILSGLVLGTLLLFVGQGRLTVAGAGAALTGLTQLRGRFGSMSYGAAGLYEAVLFLQDQEELVDLATRLERDRPTAPAPPTFEQLQVDRVTFRYPEARRDALAEVSLAIPAGQVVALVGENGSGKTTLAKLLGGLYQPTRGAIRWDGVDAATLDPDDLRRRVAVLFQDFARYNFTAADNIGLGDVDRLDDRTGVEAAARQAGADAMIRRLADGYDTVLGRLFDAGHDLSTGQWQRVALARAFFRDAPVVILDEPTAALDARAEHELFERIRALLAGRTVVLISHRFSTVRSADHIYVLHRGRVAEHGSHEELMVAGGTYAELFSLQASAFT